MSNWYLCNHPDSFFIKDLIAARPTPDRRYTVRNNELTMHHLDGRTERHLMTSGAELRAALENLLGLSVPMGSEVEGLFERLTRPTVEPPAAHIPAVTQST
jgi:N-hydroxyarylamine O-acetyltransferase